MKTITKDTLELNLKEATSNLLKMARNACWNKISYNTSYIISEIKNDSRSFKTQRIDRNKTNQEKNPITLERATAELKSIFENLYDINLEIFKSGTEIAIIDIRYYPKSALDPNFYETVKENNPMLHCKIELPSYYKQRNEKFDINWQLGGIRHEWNNFLSKIRFKICEYRVKRRKKR